MSFTANRYFTMSVLGESSIDIPFVSESGSGNSHQRNFQIRDSYQTIDLADRGDVKVSLDNPKFTLVRRALEQGAYYILNFTINSRQGIESNFGAGMPGPMPIVGLTLLDADGQSLFDMDRYCLVEFWCQDDNVERWHPEASTTDVLQQENHQEWRHKIREHFDATAMVRVRIIDQTSHYRTCG